MSTSSYNLVFERLERLSNTKVYSEKPSSILSDFWHPNNNNSNNEIKKIITKVGLSGFNFDDVRFFSEHSTYPLNDNGKLFPYSSPSIINLMIINIDYQIAIDFKYFKYMEYEKSKDESVADKDESVADWLGKKPEAHKVGVLRKWCEYIQKSEGGLNDINLEDKNFFGSFKDVSYQFINRTASACHKLSKLTFIYQLFYDDKNNQQLTDFIDDLNTWGQQMKLTIPFYIMTVPVTNGNAVQKRYSEMKSKLVLKMKKRPIYKFKWEDIEIYQVTANI
jgi:hypothetical protein